MSKIEDTVVELIQKSVSSVEQGISWLSGELPDVIHQFLLWKVISSSLIILLVLVFSLIWFRFLRRFNQITAGNRDRLNPEYIDPEPYFLGLLISGVLLIGGIVIAVGRMFQIIQILIAPKIFLLEYATSLMK